VHYDPSPSTYLLASGASAIAASPAGAALYEGADVVANVAAAAPWWGPLVSSGVAAAAGAAAIWVAKTCVAAVFRGAAAGLRARAESKKALAASTETTDDDKAIATDIAITTALAEVLDESGKSARYGE